MPDGFGTLGDRLRIVTRADASWQPQLNAMAERLAQLSPETRNKVWHDEMSRFIRLQEEAGVAAEDIGKTVDAMSRLIADLVVCLERNADDEQKRRRDACWREQARR